MRKALLAGSALAALLCAHAAAAQTADGQSGSAATTDQKASQDTDAAAAVTATGTTLRQDAKSDKTDGPDVVVTGTRLKDPSFAAPSPLQVLTADDGKERGLISVTQLVQETPAANGQQQTETSSNGFPSNGGGGSTTIDLRGMGSARTLVLINGHRVGPAGTGGSIDQLDLTLLPYAMVSRVETLTNGASTIYGSDAVAGVVNIITKDDDDGLKLSAYGQLPQHGGGNYYNLSARYGHKFERGSFSVGFGYTKANVLYASQRDATNCNSDYVFNADGSRADIRNPDGSYKCWGYGYLYKYTGAAPGSTVGYLGGYLRPSNATVGTGYYADLNGYSRIYQSTQAQADKYNGFYPYQSGGLNTGSQAMVSPSQRYSLFASGNFEISPNVELYGEGLASRRDSEQIYLTYFQTPYISPQNPNNPFNYANNPSFVDQQGNPLRSAFGITLFQFQQRPQQQVDYGTATMGLRGKLGGGWTFDVYGNFSRSDGSYSQNYVRKDRMAAADSPSGCDVTKLTTTTSCPTGGINFFRAFQTGFTPTEYDWLIGRSSGNTVYDQYYIDGSVSGTLFSLPAGDVQAAFGAHVRRESINDQPGDTSNFDTVAMQYYLSATPTVGRADTREAYGELGIPLLRGKRFAEALNLTASGRVTSAEYGGTAGTYKLGLSWHPANWLMFRATQGTSFRQPKLYELFLRNQSALSSNAQLDPCSNYQVSSYLTDTQKSRCSALFGGQNYIATGNANIISGGSTSLKPETSFARTVGVVFSPPILNTHISVDYYYIHITNSVTQLGAVNIARECLIRDPYPNNGFCGLVNRDPTTNQLVSITNNYINAGEEVYSGLDIAYTFDFSTGIGRFGSDGQFNVQLRSESATFPGAPMDSYLGYAGTPRFLGNVGIWYKPVASTLIRLSAKLVGKQSNDDYFTGASPQVGTYRDTGETVTFDRTDEFYANFTVSATRRMFGNLDLTVGIRNMFDAMPPRISTGGTGYQLYRQGTVSPLSFYDLTGRTFYLSVTKSF